MSEPNVDYLTDDERAILKKALIALVACVELGLSDLTPQEVQETNDLEKRLTKCAGIVLLA